MRAIILVVPFLGCVMPQPPCLTSMDIGIYGSESEGTSTGAPTGRNSQRERWDNDDVTVGGSATITLDFTGACDATQ